MPSALICAAALVAAAAGVDAATVGLWPSEASCAPYVNVLNALGHEPTVHHADDAQKVLWATENSDSVGEDDLPFHLIVVCDDPNLPKSTRFALNNYEHRFGVRRVAFNVNPIHVRPGAEAVLITDEIDRGGRMELTDVGMSIARAAQPSAELIEWYDWSGNVWAAKFDRETAIAPIARWVGASDAPDELELGDAGEHEQDEVTDSEDFATAILYVKLPYTNDDVDREHLSFFFQMPNYVKKAMRDFHMFWVVWGLRQLWTVDVGTSRFRLPRTIENDETVPGWQPPTSYQYELERPEIKEDIQWFCENFGGKRYSTYISEECQLAVSLIEEEKTVKAFVRDHNGIKSLTYPFDRVDGPWWKFWRRFTRKRRVLEMIRPDATSSRVQKCKSSKLRQALLTLDRKLVHIDKFTFGVVYLPSGQYREEQMYINNHADTSDAYRAFLRDLLPEVDFYGEEPDWEASEGIGFDKHTGEAHVKYGHNEITFLISTLIPYTDHERNQVALDRRMDREMVTIVFQEDPSVPFKLQTVWNTVNHVFFFVSPAGNGYKIVVAADKSLPDFDPPARIDHYEYTSEVFKDQLIRAYIAALQPEAIFRRYTNRRKELNDVIRQYWRDDDEC